MLAYRLLHKAGKELSRINYVRTEWFFSPASVLMSALILSFSSALWFGIKENTALLIFCVGVAYFLRIDLKEFLGLLGVISLFIAVMMLPYLVFPFPSINDSTLSQYITQITRGVCPAAVMILSASYLTWNGVLRALTTLGLSRNKASLLTILIISIPPTIRLFSRLLLAREARTFRKGFWTEVRSSSTAIGELLIATIRRQERLHIGMKTRVFGGDNSRVRDKCMFTVSDALLIVATSVAAFLGGIA